MHILSVRFLRLAVASTALATSLLISCSSPFDDATSSGAEIVQDLDPAMADRDHNLSFLSISLPLATVSSHLPDSSRLHASPAILPIGRWSKSGEAAFSYVSFTIDTTVFNDDFRYFFAQHDTALHSASLIMHVDPAWTETPLDEINSETIRVGLYPDSSKGLSPLDTSKIRPMPCAVSRKSAADSAFIITLDTDTMRLKLGHIIATLDTFANSAKRIDSIIRIRQYSLDSLLRVKNYSSEDSAALKTVLDSLGARKASLFSENISLAIRASGGLKGFHNSSDSRPFLCLAFVRIDTLTKTPLRDTLTNSLIIDTVKAYLTNGVTDYTVFESPDSVAVQSGRAFSSYASGRRAIIEIDLAPIWRAIDSVYAITMLRANLRIGLLSIVQRSKGVSLLYRFGAQPDTALNMAVYTQKGFAVDSAAIFHALADDPLALPVSDTLALPVGDTLAQMMKTGSRPKKAYLTIALSSSSNTWASVNWAAIAGRTLRLEAALIKTSEIPQ
jgi:hypothetical protein